MTSPPGRTWLSKGGLPNLWQRRDPLPVPTNRESVEVLRIIELELWLLLMRVRAALMISTSYLRVLIRGIHSADGPMGGRDRFRAALAPTDDTMFQLRSAGKYQISDCTRPRNLAPKLRQEGTSFHILQS